MAAALPPEVKNADGEAGTRVILCTHGIMPFRLQARRLTLIIATRESGDAPGAMTPGFGVLRSSSM